MDFDRVNPRTVRFWALIDSSIAALALPPTATAFIGALYWINGRLGGAATPPGFDPLALFFVNLSGVLVLVWVAARLLRPLGIFALIDAIGRVAVSALIAYYILRENVIPVLWFFVGTEMIGAIAQIRAIAKSS